MTVPSRPPDLPFRRPGSDAGRRAEPAADACPSCGSRVRPDQSWCTLCHAVLGPTEVGQTEVGQTEPGQTEPVVPVPEPAAAPDRSTDPDSVPDSVPVPAPAVVQAMLAELAMVERRDGLPPSVSRLVGDGPVGRAAVGAVALLVVLVAFVAGLGLIGLLL